mgnify:CR=1 FL=1
MTSFALYRLPYERQVVLVAQTKGTPVELRSVRQLDGHDGFVVAPFAISDDCPLVVIRPDVMETFADAAALSGQRFQALQPASYSGQRFQALQPLSATQQDGAMRHCYAADFHCFHAQILSERFSKIVLSRCASIPLQHPEASPAVPAMQRLEVLPSVGIAAFQRACALYPRLFVALVSTPRSGMWLTATPEVLLESTPEGRWHTMALAGTMRLDDADYHRQGGGSKADDYSGIAWTAKNIEEQRLVASYIAGCLHRFSDDVIETGPRTVRAANLVHLRSDFHFTLRESSRWDAGISLGSEVPQKQSGSALPENTASMGRLLAALHPTPAVCGLPKDEAFRFILDNEHTPRRYYSGFMGPLFGSMQTRLFVSLRCMNITPTHYHLYAGGGLLKSSTEELEWQETEAKMETMRQCVYCSSSPSMSPSM